MPDDPIDQLKTRVRREIERIRGDREHGASWLAREVAGVLAQLTSDVAEIESAERLSFVHEAARELAEARQSMAALANTVARIWSAGAERSILPSERLARKHAEAERLIGAWETASEAIASHARPLLGGTVFTLSRSGTVEEVLARLAQPESERRLHRVIVMESRPGGEGVASAGALALAGLGVTLVPDAAVGTFVREASAVVIGADSIRANGDVVNKVGSYPLALVAREAGIPVHVLAETLKIAAPDFPLILEPLEWPEQPKPLPPGTIARSVGFERVPAALITSVVTEEGALDRAQIEVRAREAGRALAALHGDFGAVGSREERR